jgi:NitT/TauT family transport system ATP-binding protein
MNGMLELLDVGRDFRTQAGEKIHALRRITASVADGDFVSIVGPSGCGKSTLLRIIGGLIGPTTGRVEFRGRQVDAPVAEVGFVFQRPVLFPWKTLEENLLFPIKLHRRLQSPDRLAAGELLKTVGLTGFESSYPFELSGGMQQRAAIASALITDPAVLLMDEPFGALDAMTREELNVELNRVWRDQAKTVILVTHDIQEAVFLSTRVLVMTARPGRIAASIDIPFGLTRTKELLAEPMFAQLAGEVRTVLYEADVA